MAIRSVALFSAFMVNVALSFPNVPHQALSSNRLFFKTDPEVNMNASEIIARWGFQPEVHDVTTPDGYILSVVRILPKTTKNVAGGKTPVIFLQHGLESSCVDWINNLPNQSAGYYFSQAGFDVWMGNFRGNKYSRRHVKLSTDDEDYWNFSFQEMAEYDLPTMIDKALEVSGSSRLYYVGFSEGTLTAFAAFSENPVLREKVQTYFAIAPVYSLKGIRGPFYYVSMMVRYLPYQYLFGRGQFVPVDSIVLDLTRMFCPQYVASAICRNVMFMFAGVQSHQMNQTRMPVYLAHIPAGTSSKNAVHFAQLAHDDTCRKFNYHYAKENMKHYGTPLPPEYDLSQVDVPTVVFWSEADALATDVDVETRLLPRLPKVIGTHKIEKFNHLDFVWGQTATEKVYSVILDYIYRD